MGLKMVGPTPRTKGNWSDAFFVLVMACLAALCAASIVNTVFFPTTREERARQAGYEAVKIHDAYEQGRQQALKENQSGHP